MRTWKKESTNWLTEPVVRSSKDQPSFPDRARALMHRWIDHAYSDLAQIKVRIGIGFRIDSESKEVTGGALSVQIGEEEPPTDFSLEEAKTFLEKARTFYADHADNEGLGDPNHVADAEKFFFAIQDGISECEKLTSQKTKH